MEKKITLVYPEVTGVIAPEIYGHFSEHIGGVIYDGIWVGKNSSVPNINGYRRELIEKLREIAPPVLRWPGGCFAEMYNWRDGIGNNRPTRTSWWTQWDGRYESNEFGTHEFFEFCELIGAKAYLAINVTSATPMEIRDWLDYCLSPSGSTTLAKLREENGRKEPFKIDYIGVGNENWGGGGNMTPEYYALEFRRFSTVIDNAAQGKIPLIIGGACAEDYAWTRGIVDTAMGVKNQIGGMSIHYYTPKNGEATVFTDGEWYGMLNDAKKMEEIIVRHHSVAVGYGAADRFPLVVDEWGCWHPDGSGPSKGYNLFEQQSTMRDAVVSALTLNIFNNHAEKLLMANVAQLCNNLHTLFLAGGEHCITTPTYHVFKMYKEHQGAECLRVLWDKSDMLSISASRKCGKILLTVANLSLDEEVKLDIEMLGASLADAAHVTVLCAEDVRMHNTFDRPDAVKPTESTVSLSEITLPVASVTAIELTVKQ